MSAERRQQTDDCKDSEYFEICGSPECERLRGYCEAEDSIPAIREDCLKIHDGLHLAPEDIKILARQEVCKQSLNGIK